MRKNMRYAGFGKKCDRIFAYNRHPYTVGLCTARACTNRLDETQMVRDPRRDLLGRDRDILLRDETEPLRILSEMRPRRDVSTSRDPRHLDRDHIPGNCSRAYCRCRRRKRSGTENAIVGWIPNWLDIPLWTRVQFFLGRGDGSTPSNLGGQKTCIYRCDFGQLLTMAGNICESNKDIDKRHRPLKIRTDNGHDRVRELGPIGIFSFFLL